MVCILATDAGTPVAGGVDLTGSTVAGLPRRLADLLEPEVAAVVVLNGPGSYTGLRAGLAAALGLGAARRLPVHCLGTLEAVGQSWSSAGAVRVLADAGRGGLYTAVYSRAETGMREVEPPRRSTAAALTDDGLPRLSVDPLGMAGLTVIDPVRALATAVPIALVRPAIDPRRPTVIYLTAAGPAVTPQV